MFKVIDNLQIQTEKFKNSFWKWENPSFFFFFLKQA